MKEKSIIETTGTIIKKEVLGTIEEEFSQGFMVLENNAPYPGYHGSTIPEYHELIPDSVFIITKHALDQEKVIRISHEVRKEYKKRFDAVQGHIQVFNEMQPCIRIKFLQSFNDVHELIMLFKKHDVAFGKYKRIAPYQGLIKINKFFSLETSEPGIYFDHDDRDICYLQINHPIDWETFEKITFGMKHNMDDNNFDAALAVILRRNCVVDCVRIYDRYLKPEKINLIRERYNNEITKLFH